MNTLTELLPSPTDDAHPTERSCDLAGWALWSDAVDAKDRLLALAGDTPLRAVVEDLAVIDAALQALGRELTVSLAVRAMCENIGQLTAEHLAARVLDQIYTAAADRERAVQHLRR
jgi:hypothetical protein